MKTLLINAHPDFSNPTHFSNQLQTHFSKRYTEQFSDEDLTLINLYDMDIPRIERDGLLKIWEKQGNGEPLNPSEEKIAQQSAELLSTFKTHHRIVISAPLHNFNITSRLKDYLDNILIARETFRYLDKPLPNGKVSVGLMTDDYRALFLFASGSIYSQQDIYQQLDFAPQYLRMIFSEIMGFDRFELVRAEGTATLPREQILEKAFSNLDRSFEKIYD